MEKYLDKSLSPEERAQDLLSKMSLEEKMGQIVGIFAFPTSQLPKEQLDGMKMMMPSGAGQVSALFMRGMEDVREALDMQRTFQRMIMELSPHHIPAIFHMEGLCGPMLTGATSFPANINRGASFDPEIERKIGEITARQELSAGITQILCPVLDVNRDPRLGRIGETYGEDPTLAAVMGTALTRGLQETKANGLHADACAKHFMGFHKSEGGIHGTNAEMGDRLLLEVYGKPFQAAIAGANLYAVMPCYDAIDGEPFSASRKFLTDMLRGEMGFQGAAISDYGAVSNIHSVHHVGETLGEGGYLSLQAGMDCELPMPAAFGMEMKKMFEDGRADIAVLDQAVLRELTAKFRMGLFEQPFAMSDEEFIKALSSDEDRAVTLQSARESLVLIKNDGTLPLKKTLKKIAVIGPHADWANHYFGGYTHLTMAEALFAAKNSMAGVMGNGEKDEVRYIPGTGVEFSETETFGKVLRWVKPGCETILERLRKDLPDTQIVYAHGYHVAGADEGEFAEALEACAGADAVILTLGGKHGTSSIATMGEGVDSTDINLPRCQDRFMEEAAKLGIPLVGVHIDGRPISSDTADRCLSAILECFSPSEATAQAVSEALRGEVNPSGKLPVSVAYNAGQIPVYFGHPYGSQQHQGESVGFDDYVNCPHTPRYAFGHGLSYTRFEYSDLTVGGVRMEGTVGKKEPKGLAEILAQARSQAAEEQPEKEVPAVAPDGKIDVSFTVKNTGGVFGIEVAQLYLRDCYASMVRPERELQGFLRVALAPGEAKKITFTADPSQMAFLTKDMRWKVEKGRFDVLIGASSEDIRLSGSFDVTEDLWIEGKARSFCAEGKAE